jgi:hypothetical protein
VLFLHASFGYIKKEFQLYTGKGAESKPSKRGTLYTKFIVSKTKNQQILYLNLKHCFLCKCSY